MIGLFLKAAKGKVLLAAGVSLCIVASADWAIGTRASLGIFYIVPMMMGGIVLPRGWTVALAVVCSISRSAFDLPAPRLEVALRFLFASLAYAISGLFVTSVIRQRDLVVGHLKKLKDEQSLRHAAEERLQMLVESSPAAILTTNADGIVLAANRAADALFGLSPDCTLAGRSLAVYIPLLADALKVPGGQPIRTAAQCQGRKANGDIFQAHTWFSSYPTPVGIQLAAIVVDSSEEMREREEQGLRQLLRGNRIAVAAVSHEVRNLCGAISLVSASLRMRHRIEQDADFQSLTTLVAGLEKIAAYDLHSAASETLEQVPLREVLDDLRIVVEPDWSEIEGQVIWRLPDAMPIVVAERHGLLQAFLNLAQNSHRAVRHSPVRQLTVSVATRGQTAEIRFADTGTGVAEPERLFEPFQAGAGGTGLGLYVSRSVVRSYGGELGFEPQNAGSCFFVKVAVAENYE